jgi:hypothetical protein
MRGEYLVAARTRLTASLDAMKSRAWILPLVVMLFALGGPNEVSAGLPASPLKSTVCELGQAARSAPQTYVDVTGARLELSEHWSVITDDRCPRRFIFLEYIKGGPSLDFCDLNFGCPANTWDYVGLSDHSRLYRSLLSPRQRCRSSSLEIHAQCGEDSILACGST